MLPPSSVAMLLVSDVYPGGNPPSNFTHLFLESYLSLKDTVRPDQSRGYTIHHR